MRKGLPQRSEAKGTWRRVCEKRTLLIWVELVILHEKIIFFDFLL